jgi:hypothetical protein
MRNSNLYLGVRRKGALLPSLSVNQLSWVINRRLIAGLSAAKRRMMISIFEGLTATTQRMITTKFIG